MVHTHAYRRPLHARHSLLAVMAYVPMAYVLMACVLMAYALMANVVMAYVFMAPITGGPCVLAIHHRGGRYD